MNERCLQFEETNGSYQCAIGRLILLACRDDLPLIRKFWLRRIVYAGRNGSLNCVFFVQSLADRCVVSRYTLLIVCYIYAVGCIVFRAFLSIFLFFHLISLTVWIY